jgi:ABC-2 type transport system ATP-binding protein
METVEELCDNIALIHKAKKVLDGPKLLIKNQFKTNTYFVEYKGILDGLEPMYEISHEKELEDGYKRTNIHLDANVTPNDLIKSLLEKVEIRAFGENIPSMSDIFMRSVNEVPEG